jgi:hypothetical protein
MTNNNYEKQLEDANEQLSMKLMEAQEDIDNIKSTVWQMFGEEYAVAFDAETPAKARRIYERLKLIKYVYTRLFPNDELPCNIDKLLTNIQNRF